MGHTVIQVPVPAVEPLVRRHLSASMPGVSVDARTVCAHITALGPFVHRRDVDDQLRATLRSLLAPVQAFTFELARVERFSSGLTYLSPEPAEPFQRLTAVLTAAFPDWPPYGGAFSDVVPHLSIGENLPESEVGALEQQLPIAATAGEVALTWWSSDSVATLATFPLLSR